MGTTILLTASAKGSTASRPFPWWLLLGCALAAVPGVALLVAAFSAFERIYRFIPVLDVILVAGFGAVLTGILVYASGADAEDHETMVLLATAAGLGFGLYTFGGWELSGSAAIFPLMAILACLGVTKTAAAAGRRRVVLGLISGVSAAGLAAVPSALLVLGLWNATVFEPELIREVGLAATMGITASATLIGLVSCFVPGWSSRQGTARRQVGSPEGRVPGPDTR